MLGFNCQREDFDLDLVDDGWRQGYSYNKIDRGYIFGSLIWNLLYRMQQNFFLSIFFIGYLFFGRLEIQNYR